MEKYNPINKDYIPAVEQLYVDNPELVGKASAKVKKVVKSFAPFLMGWSTDDAGWSLDDTVLDQAS